MPTVNRLTLPTTLSESVKRIITKRKYRRGVLVSEVPTSEVLSEVYGHALPSADTRFVIILGELKIQSISDFTDANGYLRSVNEATISLPSSSAFNNCNGSWSEYCYTAYAWNHIAELNRTAQANSGPDPYSVYIYIKLPKRNSVGTEWTRLLRENIITQLDTYPDDKSAKISDPADPNYGRRFELISSNPDFIILKFDSVEAQRIWDKNGITAINFYNDISNLGETITTALENLYKAFLGTVLPSENIQCFLSLKTSLRPDRRYQWIHEGDHVKTILQWILSSTPPLDPKLQYDDLNGKFFTISLSKITDSDKNIKDIGLVGSIITPSIKPYWAIDELFECLKLSDIADQIDKMINF